MVENREVRLRKFCCRQLGGKLLTKTSLLPSRFGGANAAYTIMQSRMAMNASVLRHGSGRCVSCTLGQFDSSKESAKQFVMRPTSNSKTEHVPSTFSHYSLSSHWVDYKGSITEENP